MNAPSAAQHTLTGPAKDTIQPGDFLPPQPALHGTEHQATGYQVGTLPRDVTESPVLSGQVLLFAREAKMLALPEDTPVTVHRAAA